MEVKKLVCDVCGGQIEMLSGGKGVCTSCGTPYSAEIIKDKIQEIRGTVKVDGPVETVKGDAEKERLLKNAETYLKLNNPGSADTELDKYIELFPYDIKPYIMKLNIFLSEDDDISFPKELFDIDSLYETIYNLDMGKEYIEEIEKRIENYAFDIMSGKKVFEFSVYNYDWLEYYNRIELMKNNHLKEILITGKENAKKINTLVYSGFSRELDPNCEDALGKSPATPCVFALAGKAFTPFGSDYSIPCERIFKKDDLNKQIKDMYVDRMRKHRCKYCGGELRGLFNKKCSRCFRPKDY